jgi:hypothetical protein
MTRRGRLWTSGRPHFGRRTSSRSKWNHVIKVGNHANVILIFRALHRASALLTSIAQWSLSRLTYLQIPKRTAAAAKNRIPSSADPAATRLQFRILRSHLRCRRSALRFPFHRPRTERVCLWSRRVLPRRDRTLSPRTCANKKLKPELAPDVRQASTARMRHHTTAVFS